MRDCMLGVMHPSNPLRVKGAPRRGRKKRKAELEDDSDVPSGDGDEYSFLSDGKDKEASDPSNDNNEASS
ncbi:hypothetical protein HAX54_011112 [Datura stramonium]|uniref:Uncharacterized protein n=1 Tax=Datura stramonium TaxID=4076 RepID=A0ABS8THC7_DATST|nr:hypothetical protein [Datura stramonium]